MGYFASKIGVDNYLARIPQYAIISVLKGNLNRMQTLKIVGIVGIGILAADFIAFCIWTLSGQSPVDSFYLGALSANIISLICHI